MSSAGVSARNRGKVTVADSHARTSNPNLTTLQNKEKQRKAPKRALMCRLVQDHQEVAIRRRASKLPSIQALMGLRLDMPTHAHT